MEMARSGPNTPHIKIGILGGTFNPIHQGHLILAKEAHKRLSLDKVIFIPALIPPHKEAQDIIPAVDRYRMVELALEIEPDLIASDIEMRRKETSYSIDTINELKTIYGAKNEILLITGADSIEELGTWKDIEGLKSICTFVITSRPGYDLQSDIPKTTTLVVKTPDISSSDIRRRIASNTPYKELLPLKVYNYIIRKGLYKTRPST